MRIAHVVGSLGLRWGGPSVSVPRLARALAEAGHAVQLLAAGTADGAVREEPGLKLVRFPRRWPAVISRSPPLRAHLRRLELDVIHSHGLWLRPLHYAHRCTRGQLPPRHVISPRGMMAPWAWRHHGLRKRLAGWLVHPGALAGAHGWHATSAEEAAEIRALGFPQPICVAPNGVDRPGDEEIARATACWRAACPAIATRPVALFYSRFHSKKRVLELIDLWLAAGPADWLLLLVGIPQEYSPESLERYAARQSGAGRIAAFSGVGQPPPYAVASLFLLPSHNENFGLVVAEAMAHGVPVVVTDTTPWSELSRRDLGWCVPWSDFGAALRAATTEAAPARRERGARACAWVLREYSWERSARDLGEFYSSLQPPAA